MNYPSRIRLACLLLAPVVALGLTSCSASKKVKAVSAVSTLPTSPVPKTSTTPVATRPATPITNPLTGSGGIPSGPVLAVKIDDTAAGRPQVGVDQADIVYIEQAEAGLTRLLAIFASHRPTVEAVRSIRAGDFELLGQYGKVGMVASGGGGDALQALKNSGLPSTINDNNGPGFARDDNRSIPYNLQANLAEVARDIKAAGVKNVGFTWAATTPLLANAKVATDVRAVVGQTNVEFRWEPALKKYVRYINGVRQTAADGAPVATPNVIVQSCRVEVRPQDVDVNGVVSRYTVTIGKGHVVIFRNGRRIDGTWSRASLTAPIVFTASGGGVIPLAPGGAWFALSQAGAPLTSN